MLNRDDYVNSIKSAFVTLGNKVVLGFLFAELPFLAVPVVRQITEYFINAILTKLVNHAEMQAFFLYIDVRTSQQGEEFEEAAYKNYLVQQNGTTAQKAAAEEELFEKFRVFAMLKT